MNETFQQLTEQSAKTFAAEVICDSLHPLGQSRLTTMTITYPRCIHAEFMTHRMFSRNAASSRAIPVEKMITRVRENPFIPLHWGKNQKGMQAEAELTEAQQLDACNYWHGAMLDACYVADRMVKLGLHKQITNRILEPWMWITVIATGTEAAWENMFALRCHPDAEPHFQKIAYLCRDKYDASQPTKLVPGMWHLPYITATTCTTAKELYPDADGYTTLAKISAGRCARVSYLTHEGKADPAADIQLYERLVKGVPLHASPLEHQAWAVDATNALGGNLGDVWVQFRKLHTNECIRTRPPVDWKPSVEQR